jgi:hypothetical protein
VSEVVLGANRFVECGSLLAYKGKCVLGVDFDPLGVRLVTPRDLPSQLWVHVDRDVVRPEDAVRIVKTASSFAVFWKEYALALATLLSPEVAHLKLDLRPIGMRVYDDVDGLHIGNNRFSGNVITRAAAAINLAD